VGENCRFEKNGISTKYQATKGFENTKEQENYYQVAEA